MAEMDSTGTSSVTLLIHQLLYQSTNIKDNNNHPTPIFSKAGDGCRLWTSPPVELVWPSGGTKDCFQNELEDNILIPLSQEQSSAVQSLGCGRWIICEPRAFTVRKLLSLGEETDRLSGMLPSPPASRLDALLHWYHGSQKRKSFGLPLTNLHYPLWSEKNSWSFLLIEPTFKISVVLIKALLGKGVCHFLLRSLTRWNIHVLKIPGLPLGSLCLLSVSCTWFGDCMLHSAFEWYVPFTVPSLSHGTVRSYRQGVSLICPPRVLAPAQRVFIKPSLIILTVPKLVFRAALGLGHLL